MDNETEMELQFHLRYYFWTGNQEYAIVDLENICKSRPTPTNKSNILNFFQEIYLSLLHVLYPVRMCTRSKEDYFSLQKSMFLRSI